jgi:hypothetical protein
MLVFNGFEGHLSWQVIDYCINHHIIAFCLPAHTSHKTQPLNVAVFGPLGRKYSTLVGKHHRVIKKEWFPHILQQARKSSCTRANAVASWAKAGLYPFKPSKLLKLLRRPAKIEYKFSESASAKMKVPPCQKNVSEPRSETSSGGTVSRVTTNKKFSKSPP